jgi:hypothetical protein
MSPEQAAVAIVSTITVFVALIAITAVVVNGISSTQRAKISVQREEAYRQLAEESAQALDRHTAAIQELSARTAEVERLLKEVE